MKKLSLLSMIFLLSACSNHFIKKGKAEMEDLSYREAAASFEKALERNPKKTAAHLEAARAYDKMNDWTNAEKHYAEAVKLEKTPVESKFRYAQLLISNGKDAEAKKWLDEYIAAHPEDEEAKEWLPGTAQKGAFLPVDASHVSVTLIPTPGVTGAFSAVPFSEGIVFVGENPVEESKSKKVNPWNGQAFLDIYYQKKNGEEWAKPQPMKGDIQSPYHDGPIFIGANGESFLTRTALKANDQLKLDKNSQVSQLKLYTFKCSEGTCIETGTLPFDMPEASMMHAAVSADGNSLVFASDKADGKGGVDLYVSRLVRHEWTEPISLGAPINTPGNEVFPFFLGNDTLFFASNGHGGMGGLDIFISIRNGSTWSHPQNLKSPINTHLDDFGFYANRDNKTGYLSSNRSGKDQVYEWKWEDPTFRVKGQVLAYNSRPVPSATIYLYEGKQVVDSIRTDKEGRFEMPLKGQKAYELNGKKGSQTTETAALSTMGLETSRVFEVELHLAPPVFAVKGRVVDKNSQKPLADVRVELSSATDGQIIQHVQSDAQGNFRFDLKAEQAYEVYAKRKKNFSRKAGISTVGLIESQTFEVVLELEEVKEQTTIVLKNIYYDYDKWDIRADAVGDLENLSRFLKDNPEITVELSAHTDARGTHKYNQELSEKRAASAKSYLEAKGIASARLLSKGFGETKPVNECVDGVECSEEKHQDNRRTEFTVLKIEGEMK